MGTEKTKRPARDVHTIFYPRRSPGGVRLEFPFGSDEAFLPVSRSRSKSNDIQLEEFPMCLGRSYPIPHEQTALANQEAFFQGAQPDSTDSPTA